jgi:uncharacterized repeat protein (TIGR01451 family)
LLQTVGYHTSCSAPIVLGDVIGGVTLTGYMGETGIEEGIPGGELGDPADEPMGPAVLQGETVVFNFEVANAGNFPLTNVQVSDSQSIAIEFVGGDDDTDGQLSPGETWLYKGESVAGAPGQQVNLGSVITDEGFNSVDPAYFFVETLKFFVVDKSEKAIYTYTETGGSIDNFGLDAVDPDKNDDPRGAASDATGDLLWLVDKDRRVFVYGSDGTSVGAWKAKDIGNEPEGIAVSPSGTDLWIVDRDKKKVFHFANGKTLTSGEFPPTASFSLQLDDKIDTKNDHPKGITTDGTYLWVVDDDGGTEKVFKYTIGGTFLGSWEIGDAALEEPRGITTDPTGATTLWIVDKKSDSVYQFNNSTEVTSGSRVADSVFPLAAENGDPEGIADPRPSLPTGDTPVALMDDSSVDRTTVVERMQTDRDEMVAFVNPDISLNLAWIDNQLQERFVTPNQFRITRFDPEDVAIERTIAIDAVYSGLEDDVGADLLVLARTSFHDLYDDATVVRAEDLVDAAVSALLFGLPSPP